jgi:prepilin-type processing-associated H-X9-DG protein
MGNLAFFDGHVEAVAPQPRLPKTFNPTQTESSRLVVTARRARVGLPYPGKIDWTPVISGGKSYQQFCLEQLDYYFWINKDTKRSAWDNR